MPAPSVATYSAAALVAAHTSFRNLIDGGSGPGKVRIRSASDVLLAEVILTDPCGTVNGTTGRLTFTFATQEDAAVGGTAAYGEFCDSANVVHLALPAEAGTSAVSGRLVMNTLSLVTGGPVDLVSATIG
jgi:hypothetical protein